MNRDGATAGSSGCIPYWRLSGFYFFYFAAIGALVPYWGLYLQFRGFDPLEIGQLMAMLMVTKIIAPNLWGWIADRTGRRMVIVRSASLLAMLSFLELFLVQGFWGLALVMVLFSFFWNASLPQFEAVTINHLGLQFRHYSRIRLWGSVGFVAAASLLGGLLDVFGLELVPISVLVFFFGIWLCALWVPDSCPPDSQASSESLREVLKQPAVLAFLGACFLAQAGHGTYYAFYSIYMEQHGYSSLVIGQLWSLGVLAEILVFLIMHRVLDRYSARDMLLLSLLLGVLRWLLVGFFPQHLWLMLFAQLMHAGTFGTFHAAAMQLVHHHFTGRVQGRGQALYSSLSFGAGGALGSLYSGYWWEQPGPTFTFVFSAAMALVAYVVAQRWIGRG